MKAAFDRFGRHNGGILAAGVAYFAFLALVPLLAAAVLGYGLFADPQMVAQNINALADNLPASATQIIADQLRAVVETSETTKGLGLALAIGLALFGARNGAGSLVNAVSLAFEAHERRSFVRGNLVALAVTGAGIVGAGLVVAALAAAAMLETGQWFSRVLAYLVLAGAGTAGAAMLYRHAPYGPDPDWRQLLPGAAFAGVMLVALTGLFGVYVANFGDYNATYGSLSAVVVLLTWLYLSAYVLLFGAELAAVAPSDDGA